LIINPVFISCLPLFFWGAKKETLSMNLSVCVIKVLGDYYLGNKIKTSLNPLAYLLSPVKDLFIGLIWFAPLADDTVTWRGNRYLIGKNTRLSLCPNSEGTWRYRIMDGIKAKLAW
jgi:ceramide glucosyltransferase